MEVPGRGGKLSWEALGGTLKSMNVLWLTMVWLTLAGDVGRAQELYLKAQYAASLEVLGSSCDTALDYVTCEKVRGSVMSALGKQPEAVTAFARALLQEPDFDLPPSSSPKLLELLTLAKGAVARLLEFKLEVVTSTADNNVWRFASLGLGTARLGEGLLVEGISLYFSPPGAEDYFPVALRPVGELWVGELSIGGSDGGGLGHYYTTWTLTNGESLRVGDSEAAKRVRVRREFQTDQFRAFTDPWVPVVPVAPPIQEETEPLPTWVSPVLVGSLVAVVAGAVITGIVVWFSRPQPNQDQETAPGTQFQRAEGGMTLGQW